MESEIYKRNAAAFLGEEAELKSTGSVFKQNLNRFHGLEPEAAKFKIAAKPGQANEASANANVNLKSGLYKKSIANFHGVDKVETESQGTHFQ